MSRWPDLERFASAPYGIQRNKVEWRQASPPHETALRQHIRNLWGEKLAEQPFESLVNVAEPSESRILKGPLAASAGGWEQITNGGWRSTEEPGYRTLRQLVEASIAPREFHDIAGTCGRYQCVCGTCWVRRAEEQRRKQTAPDTVKSASVPATALGPNVTRRLPTAGGVAGSE